MLLVLLLSTVTDCVLTTSTTHCIAGTTGNAGESSERWGGAHMGFPECIDLYHCELNCIGLLPPQLSESFYGRKEEKKEKKKLKWNKVAFCLSQVATFKTTS